MVSEAERIRAPLEYPEHEDLSHEDPLISEGTITDYITGREVKDSPKERVRQRIVRALFHEYGFSTESMESDFPDSCRGRREDAAQEGRNRDFRLWQGTHS